MVRDEGDPALEAILSTPRGHLIHMAAETLGAIKLGIKIDRSEIPADEYAVMLCIERESNKAQTEKMKAQQ